MSDESYDEIIDTAIRAFQYFDQFYEAGHYVLPYGYPMTYDGVAVPWNWQNSMAEVSLFLYKLTNEEQYRERCEELLREFKTEWEVENDRIYWHYWPLSHYEGWEDNEVSAHTPALNPIDDYLYEDITHAGMSVRVLYEYYEVFPDGVISREDIDKITNNMNMFCCKNGFSRFISGNTEYQPLAWIYLPGRDWCLLENANLERFVRQGAVKSFPEWDSQGTIFSNAVYYNPNGEDQPVIIKRYIINGEIESDEWSEVASYTVYREDIKKFIGANYTLDNSVQNIELCN